MSDRALVDFLATVPLFQGRDAAELAELARVVRRRRLPEGELLWRQGDDARDLVIVADGAVAVSLHVPGERPVELARAGPGDVVGEIALLDGKGHTMSARVTEAATLLVLGRADFAALFSRQTSSAFTLKRRLATLFTARLRNQLAHLSASLVGDVAASQDEAAAGVPAELEYCGPPDPGYVRRMATFHEFDSLALWGFLTSGRYARCPPGRTLIAEGASSTACYLTINGAVETVLVRGDRRVRVGLAGPGKAFGYEGLIDGDPSPLTAITRERTLLLVLPCDSFEMLYNGEDAVSRVFLDVIQRELVASLRYTLRQNVRFAASV
jgi:CRP/FNR family transcriptional regulator, cyclic AMP receptor protein